MSQNMNQFKQTKVVGDIDLSVNASPNRFTCTFVDASDTDGTTLVPGEGVILKDLGSSDVAGIPPIVDERASDNDAIFGVKIYDTKKNASVSEDIVQIAGKGSVVYMNAGAAIARGARVALVLATPGNVVTATTESEVGTALDKAAASGTLIRVLIDPLTVST